MITFSITSERIINNDAINWHALKKKKYKEKKKKFIGVGPFYPVGDEAVWTE